MYYGYDLRGLTPFARFDGPSGEGVTNAHDALGRLTQQWNGGGILDHDGSELIAEWDGITVRDYGDRITDYGDSALN